MEDEVHFQNLPLRWPHPDKTRFKAIRNALRKNVEAPCLGYRRVLEQNKLGKYNWISKNLCLSRICSFAFGLRSLGLSKVYIFLFALIIFLIF